MKKNSGGKSRHVFIIGAKGLGGYGGFETFVRKLAEYRPDTAEGGRTRIIYHICCKENGYGSYDEHLMKHVRELGKKDFSYCGVHCHKIHIPEIGAAQAVLYDLFSLLWAVRMSIRHRLHGPVFYILSCRLGIVIDVLSWFIHLFGGALYLNPDGHEWMREKWSPAIRKYLKFSESRMVRCADRVICDSEAIEAYIREEYGLTKERTAFIPYGAELPSVLVEPEAGERAVQWLSRHGLKPEEYYLMISRLVPENSYERIIREFLQSSSSRKLLMITTENPKLKKELERKLHYSEDPRILFADAVYDDPMLNAVRKNAYGYIHGHTVGGTNPGLLEAMAHSGFCLVLDVPFNRETAGDSALYWTGEEGCLSGLIDSADKMKPEQIQKIRTAVKERIRKKYPWEAIAASYDNVFQYRS